MESSKSLRIPVFQRRHEVFCSNHMPLIPVKLVALQIRAEVES